jgi:hypothetical protein
LNPPSKGDILSRMLWGPQALIRCLLLTTSLGSDLSSGAEAARLFECLQQRLRLEFHRSRLLGNALSPEITVACRSGRPDGVRICDRRLPRVSQTVHLFFSVLSAVPADEIKK